ncbi:MAG: hypothetical protein ABI580_12260 [Burkholderiaceae bacterium]
MLKRFLALCLLLLGSSASFAQPSTNAAVARCGEVITVDTHDGSTTRYSLAQPAQTNSLDRPIALVLLAGGTGYLNLDSAGCPRALRGNSLVRSIPHFRAAGFFTALVDAPSTHHGVDGLEGFRIHAQHAEDLGKVIADIQARTKAAVWLVGTSRGAISAVNAASRLSGAAEPAGVVLTSAVTAGQSGARKAWAAQSVFDLKLEAITMPLLVVGHAADNCIRSPANLMGNITARTSSTREEIVTVTGGRRCGGRVVGRCVRGPDTAWLHRSGG